MLNILWSHTKVLTKLLLGCPLPHHTKSSLQLYLRLARLLDGYEMQWLRSSSQTVSDIRFTPQFRN